MREQSSFSNENPEAYAELLDQWIDARLLAIETTPAIQHDHELLLLRLLEEGQQLAPAADFVDGLAQKFSKMPQVRQPTGKRWLFVGRPGRRFAVALVSLVLVISLSLLVSPQIRASLLDMIYGMRMIDSQALQSLAIERVTPDIGQPLPARPLAEIIRQAPFAFRIPSRLPRDLVYVNGYVGQDFAKQDYVEQGSGGRSKDEQERSRATISLVFMPKHLSERDDLNPMEIPTLLFVVQRGEQSTQPILDSSAVEPAQIGSQPALYAKGSWTAGSKGGDKGRSDSTEGSLDGVTWDKNIDANWLIWHEGPLTYWFVAEGLKLDKNELIQLAESLEETQP